MPVAGRSDVVGQICCNLNLLDGLIPHNVTICNHFAILQLLVPMLLPHSVLHQFLAGLKARADKLKTNCPSGT